MFQDSRPHTRAEDPYVSLPSLVLKVFVYVHRWGRCSRRTRVYSTYQPSQKRACNSESPLPVVTVNESSSDQTRIDVGCDGSSKILSNKDLQNILKNYGRTKPVGKETNLSSRPRSPRSPSGCVDRWRRAITGVVCLKLGSWIFMSLK